MNGHLRLEFYNTMHDFFLYEEKYTTREMHNSKLNGIFVGTDALHFFCQQSYCSPNCFPIGYHNLYVQFLFNENSYKHII